MYADFQPEASINIPLIWGINAWPIAPPDAAKPSASPGFSLNQNPTLAYKGEKNYQGI